VESNQYVNFKEEPAETALFRWHDTILACFALLTERFGRDTATKVCDLGLHSCCLYPWEMERAAEEMHKGTSVHDISCLVLDGGLEAEKPEFPKLQMVLDGMAPSQDIHLNMTL